MLSLPLIVPRDDLTVWLQPSLRNTQAPDPQDGSSETLAATNARRTNSRARSTLSQLILDENAIEQRKQNVRRFGAGWIRPPGIAKTYQATMDEIAEKEEQLMLERRDQQMQDLANAQEMEARRQQALEAGETGDAEGPEGEAERDLDEDVPEAEDMTFNEESMLEGSMVAGEEDADASADGDVEVDVERMLDLEEAEMSGMLEVDRDLDDDVPEAGSYQHTDTELEDDSSDADEPTDTRSPRLGAARARQSLMSDGEAHTLSSSLLGSSPAARRGLARGNAFRDRFLQDGQG